MSAPASGPVRDVDTAIAVQERAGSIQVGITNALNGLLANQWLTAALILLFTRAVAFLGAYSGASYLVQQEPSRVRGWILEMSLAWDAGWYLGIANYGYFWDPAFEGAQNIAFPPLYPFLVDCVANLLNWVSFGWDWGSPSDGRAVAAGYLVSNASFLVALVLLMRLLTPRLGRRGAAWLALVMASLPLSFFFSALYTEGLFLMLVLGSLLVARSDWSGKWAAAGAVGMLASLDRLAGALVLPVLLVEYLSQRGWSLRRVRLDALWLSLVPLGVGVYLAFLWWRFGSPFILFDNMYRGWSHEGSLFLATYWDEGLVPLLKTFADPVPPEAGWVLQHGRGDRLFLMLDVAMPVLLLAGGIAARTKLLASEWVWLLLGIVFPLSSGHTNSLARYMLPLWPGLIWLALVPGKWRWLAPVWLAISLALLFRCAYVYGSNRWIG